MAEVEAENIVNWAWNYFFFELASRLIVNR
jgi:hypothetical protein